MTAYKIALLLCLALVAGGGAEVAPRQKGKLGLLRQLPMPLRSVPHPHTLSIGASPATKGQFPFFVSLQVLGEHVCGGSIISHHTVLTAAHCMTFPAYYYEVVAGDHDLKIEEGTEQWRIVTSFVTHPDYKRYTSTGFSPNDVSILLLNEPLVFTDYVKPIKLAAPGVNHNGTTVLSGWGVTDSISRTRPDVLLTEELPVVNHSVCVDRVGRRFLGVSEDDLPDSILCTGPLAGGMGPCPGDSGGPLTQNGVLVGVVSWGPYICGTANVPSGFTRVSAFTQWIITADRQLRDRQRTQVFTLERHLPPGFPAPPRPAPPLAPPTARSSRATAENGSRVVMR